ncbi:hypothetical protein GCM10010156_38660 [Planobispora rosea]|uniref:Uncharacterized protein n=1 Tax=Planobispora rosea TaxID=35762 RepID=A0A8J3WEW1_PLARO|nr:hypothetical protein [Planobispora rosea]GGS76162.1 hypothetical protein GCM10010156_38660 [Planobispora rosea]GIH86252.1 hypothetical protein Pro02_46600 [Planobispora rosea]
MTWKQVRTIPGEPAELRGYLQERIDRITRRLEAADPAPGTDIEQLRASLLRQGCVDVISRLPASSGARASAYRILASLPGIRAEGEVTDPLGRRGQALGYQVEAEPGLFNEIRFVVDPGTGLPLAEVWTHAGRLADGRQVEIGHSTSFQAIGWTDERPEMPGHRD